jgi:hypothetical protein
VLNGDIVLPHVHSIGGHLEGQLGIIIHNERHIEFMANSTHVASSYALSVTIGVLFAQLDNVDPAAKDCGQEGAHVGPNADAEVEMARRQIPHVTTLGERFA